MKRILIATAIAAMSVFGAANMAQADHTPTDPDPHGPYPAPPTSAVVAQEPPVLTVPPLITPLPVTGTNSFDTLAVAAVAVAVGGGLVVVTKTRRRVSGSAA